MSRLVLDMYCTLLSSGQFQKLGLALETMLHISELFSMHNLLVIPSHEKWSSKYRLFALFLKSNASRAS